MAHKVYRLIEKERIMAALDDAELHKLAMRAEEIYYRDGNMTASLQKALKAAKAEIVKVKDVR